ncbi:Protein FAR1-RELATED SEQUENCE 11 [Bienertia sinuspersici]
MLGVDDAKNLIEYMKYAKEENEMFQYAYTLDEERRLENLFWCHAQSFEWYQKYGDVVVFDTTYKVNSYDMPCGICVGGDNHGKTILFGCALLRNKTTSTFKWLKKILGCPKQFHLKCQLQNKDFVYGISLQNLVVGLWLFYAMTTRSGDDFYRLYKMTIPEEFELNWSFIVQK